MKTLDSYSTSTTHSAQSVFARWADPAGWPTWDTEVREVSFPGPTALGARGRMRPASGPATAFSITALEPDRLLTNASSLPGAKLLFEHRVTPTKDGADLEVTVAVDGFLAPLWQRVLRASMKNAAQSSVTGLLNHLDAG